MTPKEKAHELIEKFDYPNIPTGLMSTERKQCALICADEMIKHLPSSNGNPPNLTTNQYDCEYWQEVKKEIENL